MKEVLIMCKLLNKRLPKELKEFIYSTLKLTYLDGRIDGIDNILNKSKKHEINSMTYDPAIDKPNQRIIEKEEWD